MPFRSRLVSDPFMDPSFHFLVGDESLLFDVMLCLTHGSKKGNLIGSVAIIDVVRKTINRLKHLFLNTHGRRLLEKQQTRNADIGIPKFLMAMAPSPTREANRKAVRLAAETSRLAACAPQATPDPSLQNAADAALPFLVSEETPKAFGDDLCNPPRRASFAVAPSRPSSRPRPRCA